MKLTVLRKKQSIGALSPIGEVQLTVAARASTWLARLGSVLAAACGVAGIALVINAGRGWLTRRQQKTQQAEAEGSSNENQPDRPGERPRRRNSRGS